MQVEIYKDHKDVEYWESCLEKKGTFEISGFANNDKAVTRGTLVAVERVEHYDTKDSIEFYKTIHVKIESRELGGTVTYDIPTSNVKRVTWH